MHVAHFAAVFGSNPCWRVQLAWSVLNMGKKPEVSQSKPERKDKKEKRSLKDTKKTSKIASRALTSVDSNSGSSRSPHFEVEDVATSSSFAWAQLCPQS